MDTQVMSPKILVAPLDWGLGHATRCIPIIQALALRKCEVIIAAEGKIKALLQKEFPLLRFIDLPGYKVTYGSGTSFFVLKIVAQIPKIVRAIKLENKWLDKFIGEEKIDAIISDNRYGLWHSKLITVFITHQLQIKVPVKRMENIIQTINYRHINQFDFCWIPDEEGPDNYAGELAHPIKKPAIPIYYLGTLSRIQKADVQEEKYILILLSGPEPQRSLLEKKVVDELKDYTKPVVLVRGLPDSPDVLKLKANILVFNHLPTDMLAEKMNAASFIISRCGYSTVMDLVAIKKKSILMATPGQTEQEYLAKYLMDKCFALCIEEKKFRLKQALDLASSFAYHNETREQDGLEPAIECLLQKIQKKNSDKQINQNASLP